jgi:hypothetical protein
MGREGFASPKDQQGNRGHKQNGGQEYPVIDQCGQSPPQPGGFNFRNFVGLGMPMLHASCFMVAIASFR